MTKILMKVFKIKNIEISYSNRKFQKLKSQLDDMAVTNQIGINDSSQPIVLWGKSIRAILFEADKIVIDEIIYKNRNTVGNQNYPHDAGFDYLAATVNHELRKWFAFDGKN